MAHSANDQTVLATLNEIRHAQSQLAAAVDSLATSIGLQRQEPEASTASAVFTSDPATSDEADLHDVGATPQSSLSMQKSAFTSRIVLT